MSSTNRASEITITRIYDAPVKMVWDAWTDLEQVAQWWGPRGFTITTHAKELKPGGFWNYTMHGPDGVDYPNKTVYFEVEECKKLVYDHGANDDQPALFRVTVLFTELDGKTKMDMTMSCASPEAANNIRQFIKQASGNSTWDRLGEYLEKESTQKEIFIINRSFNAPIEIVFDAWTQPEHVSKWLAPAGSEMKYFRCEIKEGGSSFYKMSNEHYTLYGKANYMEIKRPNLLVYTQEFCDEHENMSRHPFAPTWPETMLTVVTFTAEENNATRVTVCWQPFGDFTVDEVKAFVDAKAGMTQGWTGSFDKLEDYLVAIPARA